MSSMDGAPYAQKSGRARRQRPGQRERAAARAMQLAHELEAADRAAHEEFLADPAGDGATAAPEVDPPAVPEASPAAAE
eukprot:11531683-Alexandrium_andersonii.AAC.1